MPKSAWRPYLAVLVLWWCTWIWHIHYSPAASPPTLLGTTSSQTNNGAGLSAWSGADARQYIEIALHGYQSRAFGPQGWFPGWPLFIWVFSLVLPASVRTFDSLVVLGLLLNHLLLVPLIWNLWWLAKKGSTASNESADPHQADQRSQQMRENSIWIWLTFPGSFFLAAPYNETLYLLLCCSSFNLCSVGRSGWASLLASSAALVRPAGLVLAPSLALQAWSQQPRPRYWWLPLTMVPLAPLAFFTFLHYRIGDFWGYVRCQNALTDRVGGWSALKGQHPLTLANILGLVCALGVMALLARYWKRLTPAYRCFVLANLLLTGWHGLWTSQPRYTLELFPLFLLLGRDTDPAKARWLVGFNLLLGGIALLSFLQGWPYLF